MSLEKDPDILMKNPRLAKLKIDYRQDTKDAINEEIEAIAVMIENKDFDYDKYEFWDFLGDVAKAIRARKRT